MSHFTLVLSSTSPARRMLLERLRIPFSTNAPNIDETPLPRETPLKLVERLAKNKAQASTKLFPKALIIGCDQVAVINNQIVSKPETHENAITQLKYASGKCIEFYTGLCLLNSLTNHLQVHTEKYKVYYRKLTDAMIKNYLYKEKPYQCAGSIQVEGLGISLLERLEGNDPTALTGLPLIALIRMLENENIFIIGPIDNQG